MPNETNKKDNSVFSSTYKPYYEGYEVYDNGLGEGNKGRSVLDKVGFGKSVYDYLKAYRRTRGVGVITDSQSIFYTQFLDRSYGATHDELTARIEDIIHHQDIGMGNFYDNHIYIFAIADYFYINFPDDGTLSMNQYKYLCDVLDQIDKFNNESSERKKTHITFFGRTELQNKFIREFDEVQDISKMKEKLKKLITPSVDIQKEVIIGKTLSEEELTQSILFNIGIKDIMTVDEVRLMLKMCTKYYSNENYRDAFLKIFPKYEEISLLVELLYRLENVAGVGLLDSLSFHNMPDIFNNSGLIKEAIKTIFDGNIDYDTMRKIINSIHFVDNSKLITNIFPYFDFVYKFMSDTYLSYSEIEEVNLMLAEAKTYDDKVRVIMNFFYKKTLDDISRAEDNKTTIDNNYEYMFAGKRIIANKELLNSLIERYNELRKSGNDISGELGRLDFLMQMNESSIRNYTNYLNSYTSSFWRKLLNAGKIKKYKKNLFELNNTRIDLERKYKDYTAERDRFVQEEKEIENKFKEITGLYYIVSDVSSMDFYYSRDYTEVEKSYQSYIEENTIELFKLRKRLKMIQQSGLIEVEKDMGIKK